MTATGCEIHVCNNDNYNYHDNGDNSEGRLHFWKKMSPWQRVTATDEIRGDESDLVEEMKDLKKKNGRNKYFKKKLQTF